jgi:TatD DNase family protein
MILTDTHTHIYISELRSNISAIMHRALEQRVSRFFLPNIDLESIDDVFSLTALYPDKCYPMMGLHPCSVKDDYADVLAQIKNHIDKPDIIAIGEIGIDLYWDKTTLEIQKEAFRIQIQWAKERKLPIVIHCRDAFQKIYDILKEEKDESLRGVFHCFTGSIEQARLITDLGFYLGIGGVLTYKNAGLPEVIKQVDMKHIVLETDSPYLTPAPHRGKPNESSYLIYVAEKLAEIKGMGLNEIADITTENSKLLFGK